MSKRALSAAIVAAVATTGGAQAAQVLMEINYDSLTPTYSYGYSYGQITGGTFTQTVEALGVSGTNALVIRANGTTVSGAWWGFGGGSGNVRGNRPMPDLTSNIGFDQFTYQFDLFLTGFDNPVSTTGINFELSFTVPAGVAGPSATRIAAFNISGANYNVTQGGFQRFTGTFAGATFGNPQQATLWPQYWNQVNQIQLNVNMNGGNDFGRGPGPYVAVIDNIKITQLSPGPTILQGDLNFDGLLDSGDIDAFAEALLESDPYDSFIAAYGAAFTATYGGTLTPALVVAFGDFDNNSIFDAGDIDPFITAVLGGSRPGASAIPEPAALGILSPMALLAARRRRS